MQVAAVVRLVMVRVAAVARLVAVEPAAEPAPSPPGRSSTGLGTWACVGWWSPVAVVPKAPWVAASLPVAGVVDYPLGVPKAAQVAPQSEPLVGDSPAVVVAPLAGIRSPPDRPAG